MAFKSKTIQKTLQHFMKPKSKQPKDLHAPNKPLSSYLSFSEQRRPQLQSLNPKATSLEITKTLNIEWTAMDKNDKQKYENVADDARIAYELQMEEYKQTNDYKQYQKKLSEWQSTQKNVRCAKGNDEEIKSDDQNKNKRFQLYHAKGDLFSSPSSCSLCHCISRDIVMGKGIAKIFKQKFGGVSELKRQSKQIGECGVLLRDNRFIYYMMTKEKYWNKPTYASLRQTLEYMKDHGMKNNVKHIAMPRIGCGLDKLVWSKVEAIIMDTFSDSDMSITVYTL